RLGGERVVAVALDLVAERPDHLRVAEIAALADVDVAAGELERGVGADAIDRLDGALQIEERHDFDEAADGDDDQRREQQVDGVGFEDLVLVEEGHGDVASPSAGTRAGGAAGTASESGRAIVSQMLTAMITVPARKRKPPSALIR